MRLRPVLMTASVAILGLIPMLFTSTALTLLLLPLMYEWLETRRERKAASA